MRSGFFDSDISGYDAEGLPIFDRAEDAAFFARFFGGFLTSGVYPEPGDGLEIVPGDGLAVRVRPGVCYIRGRMGWQEDEQAFALAAPGAATRVDGVFARLSLSERAVSICVKNGDVVPARGDDVFELLLADVSVAPGAAQIASADIHDRRADDAVCGFVAGLDQFSNVLNELAKKAPIANPTFTGTVRGVSKAMVGLGNVDNTSDANKPVSTATQTALNTKAPITNPTFTGTVKGITKAMVGLGNVDNTSDANKPVSTATQNALNTKAPIANPTFTGTVKGISKAMVGLGSVDNTSDANKPVSTATQNALNAKANKAIDRTATITTTWVGSAAPYTQDVAVSGITAAMQPLVSPVYDAALDTALAQKEAWACVSKGVAYDGGITFTCFEEMPTTAIPILIKVVG